HARSSTRCSTAGAMVGVQRFELWTPGSQNRCSTRLSYTPKSRLSVSLFGGKGQAADAGHTALLTGKPAPPRKKHDRFDQTLAAWPRQPALAAILFRRCARRGIAVACRHLGVPGIHILA